MALTPRLALLRPMSCDVKAESTISWRWPSSSAVPSSREGWPQSRDASNPRGRARLGSACSLDWVDNQKDHTINFLSLGLAQRGVEGTAFASLISGPCL